MVKSKFQNKIVSYEHLALKTITVILLPVILAAQPGKGNYAKVNSLNMYYEIHGTGNPLVLIHGGGSSIQSTFGRILPNLVKNKMIIAVELQAHGHTGDIDRPLSFEQDADDVVELLKQLNINKADFFGFSNGGTAALQIAIRHPGIVNKLIIGSANFKKEGIPEQVRASFREDLTPDSMPEVLRKDYMDSAPDTSALPLLVKKLMNRLINFRDIPEKDLTLIKAPTMIIIGNSDVITVEHALEMHKTIPNSNIIVLPGVHGAYIGEATAMTDGSKLPEFTAVIIDNFLNQPDVN